METCYDEAFYRGQKDGSYASAKIVIPIVKQYVNPHTVIDMGCGLGTWLAVWKSGGANVIGCDGDYVDRDMLYIDKEEFVSVDLSKDCVKTDYRVDLAMSLEVAEHLPSSRADSFIRDLTELSDIILFSAAIPFQGGTNHINEQWQSYWADLFAKRGYVPVDCIRPKIWNTEGIIICYAQNILLYVKEDNLAEHPLLLEYYLKHREHTFLNMVHPSAWQLSMSHFVTPNRTGSEQ